MQNRTSVSAVLLICTFVCALLFSGTAANLVIFLSAMMFLLMAFMVAGANSLKIAIESHSRSSFLALVTLAVICVLYHFSMSRETSYPMSWLFAALPLTFLISMYIRSTPRGEALLLAGILFVVVGLALLSVFRFFVYGERAHMPLIDPNNFATMMYLVWIPFVHWMLVDHNNIFSPSKWWKIIGYAVSFTLLCAMFATQSRMGAYICGLTFLLWLYLGFRNRLSAKNIFSHLCLFVIAFMFAGDNGLSTLGEGAAPGDVGSGLQVRLLMIESAIQMYLDYPWYGIGLMGFGMLYPTYRSINEQDTAGLFVHNDYVQVLIEGGIPLFMCLILFVGGVGFFSIKLLNRNTPIQDVSRLGYGIAIGAACGHALINFVFYSLPLMILIGIGSAFLLTSPVKSAENEVVRKRDSKPVLVLYGGGIVFGVFAWFYLLLDTSVLGVFMAQKHVFWVDHIRTDEQKTLQFSRLAQALNSNRGLPYLGEAVLLNRFAIRDAQDQEKRGAAFAMLTQALSADPHNPAVYLEMVKHLDNFQAAYVQGKPLQQMELLLFRALELDPINIPAIDYLSALYIGVGTPKKKMDLLEDKIMPWFERLKLRDEVVFRRYYTELLEYAIGNGKLELVEELNKLNLRLRDVKAVEHRSWL